jgi:flagellar basal body-associated protein FliL
MVAAPDPAPAEIPAAERNGQLIVSLAIVVVLGVVAIALIIAAMVTKDWTFAAGAVGAIVGALATALNTPSGISNALRASKTSPP